MGRLLLALPLLLSLTACTEGVHLVDRPVEPLRFIHPRSRVAIAGPAGIEVWVQVWLLQDEAHRGILLSWRGPGCSGSSGWSLDGKYEAAVQPSMAPKKIRVAPGVCTIVAEVFGPGQRVLKRATFDLTVMGGEA